jgi:epoxyqueuosine reductase
VHAVVLRTPEKPTARRPHRDARSYAFGLRRVRLPVPSGITKWLCRQISRSCCPWNVRFSKELPADSPYAEREALAGKDARTLAREILGMTQEEFCRTFKGSPMKRAMLRGPKRNAAVVLGNVGTADDVEVLERAPTPSRSSASTPRGRWSGSAAARALARSDILP